MKCPQCGAWNAAYLPKCTRCGSVLEGNAGGKTASWEESLHKKKPQLKITQFEQGEDDIDAVTDEQTMIYDPDYVDRAAITDELEELQRRKEEGQRRIAQMKEQATRVRRSIQEAQIIRPLPEPGDVPPPRPETEQAPAHNRKQRRQIEYTAAPMPEDDEPVPASRPQDSAGYFSDPLSDRKLSYVENEEAPIFYDGYTPDSGDVGAYTDDEYMPRRIQPRQNREESYDAFVSGHRKKNRAASIILRILFFLLCCAACVGISLFLAMKFSESQGIRAVQSGETQVDLTKTTVDGHPAHTITIYGRENATIYIRETQSTYVIADGKVDITIPDYMWYDTESSTFATPVETDTMDVTITPFIRYSQEGDQFELEPINYTIDVPLSPITLINPPTEYQEVGVSIYEVRINVELGSTVVIDGTNVSTLIRAETGNVSKNVSVLPVGENIISISVKSKYCREHKKEIVLYRAPQDIALELDATVLVEWNYEPVTEEKYNHATDEEKLELYVPSISGTTLPGADITVEFPHWGLEVDKTTGKFTFHPIFSELGNNDVVIRASYEGKTDSVITHTVYYMPNADIYTRRAWDLDSQYTDLINYINMRKGTIYRGVGTVQRIISTAPQLAILNIGTEEMEKLVLIENSSKTTWEVGKKYLIFGEAYGLYDTMPRLTVRYTYLED